MIKIKSILMSLVFAILAINVSYGQLKSAQNPVMTKEQEEAIESKAKVPCAVWLENMISAHNLYITGTQTTSQLKIRRSENPGAKLEVLYIVNGKTITGNNLDQAMINPSDVESIDVMKGSSALALFGEKGANGVILITTKKAKSE